MNPYRRREGVALLFVLGAMAVLAAVASALHRSSLDDWRLGRSELDRVRAEAVALCALEVAGVLMARDDRPYSWFPRRGADGAPPRTADDQTIQLSEIEEAWMELAGEPAREARIDGEAVVLEVEDEGSRMNLNRVPGENLARLVQVVGGGTGETEGTLGPRPEARVLGMISGLEDWRDPDGEIRAEGAESGFYEDRDPVGYLPRNGALQSVEELALVRGWSGVWRKPSSAPMVREGGPPVEVALLDLVTVHGVTPRISVNAASRVVLSAVPGIFESPVREELLDRLERHRPYRNRNEVLAVLEAVDPSAAAAAAGWVDVRSDFFRLVASVPVRGGSRLRLVRVVRRLPDGRQVIVEQRKA